MSRAVVVSPSPAGRPACALFVGGVRSGKSGLAQKWAEARAPLRLYVATCAPHDAEMAERVRLHQASRGPGWACLEVPLDVPEALDALWAGHAPESSAGVLLLDCVSMWVANLLGAGLDDAAALARVEALAKSLERRTAPVAVVTAETGLGLVPPSPLGRRFLDVLGLANQRLARLADPVVLAVCGRALALPGPSPKNWSCTHEVSVLPAPPRAFSRPHPPGKSLRRGRGRRGSGPLPRRSRPGHRQGRCGRL